MRVLKYRAEKTISRLEELNRRTREKEVESKEKMVGSLDVEALYTSVDVKKAGKIGKDRV